MGEDILLSLKDVVEREANIKPYKVLPFKSIFRYRITSKREAIKLLNYMYENATIYLDRKYENYLKFAVLSQKSQKA